MRLPWPYSTAVTTTSSVASSRLSLSHDLPRRPGRVGRLGIFDHQAFVAARLCGFEELIEFLGET